MAESVAVSTRNHPWPTGQIFFSPGGHFCYRVIGPCCRLFDREQLPWPCCRLQWRGKEPSWRRIGKRFVPDISIKGYPSYAVEILGQGRSAKMMVITLYTMKLSASQKEWWYSRSLMAESVEGQTIERTHDCSLSDATV